MEEPKLGTRIAIGNKRGTVKFCGKLNEVDGGKELWLGIDWGRADEGKHDGSYKGVQYFKTRYPTSGSFVKAIHAQYCRGFMETLREHYFELFNDVSTDNEINFVLKKSAVSFENAFNMSVINLPNHRISFLESDAERRFEACTILDLSNNLLHDWEDLFNILKLFPSLVTLNISLNVMQPLEPNPHPSQFQIKELVLNDCQLDLKLLSSLPSYFPALETLRIMKNELDTLPSLNNFTNLKHLFAGNNPFNNFTELWNLASHEKLETLSLPGCGFKSIRFPEPTGFNSLRVLNLNENPFNDWESINEIGRLQSLKNFRSSGIYAGERGCQSYEILVAKLPRLTILDSCTISSSERKECECFFFQHFGKEPLLEVHRSDLERLSTVYGELLESNTNEQVASNSCAFVLNYNGKTIERTLPLNLSIRKLVTLASRMFSFEPSSVKVSVQIYEDNYEIIKWDASTVLRAFDPEPGCKINFYKKLNDCY